MALDEIILYRVMFGNEEFLRQFEEGMPIVSKQAAELWVDNNDLVPKDKWDFMADEEDNKVRTCNHPFYFHTEDIEYETRGWIFKKTIREPHIFRAKYALPVLNMRGLSTYGTSWATDPETAHEYLDYRSGGLRTPMSLDAALEQVGNTGNWLNTVATATFMQFDHNKRISNGERIPFMIVEARFSSEDQRLVDLRKGAYPLLAFRKGLHWDEIYVAGAVRKDEYQVVEKGSLR